MKKDCTNFLFCIILSKNFRAAHFLPVSTVIVSLMIAVLRSLHRNGATWQAPSQLYTPTVKSQDPDPHFEYGTAILQITEQTQQETTRKRSEPTNCRKKLGNSPDYAKTRHLCICTVTNLCMNNVLESKTQYQDRKHCTRIEKIVPY